MTDSFWWVAGAFVLGFYTGLFALAMMSMAANGGRESAAGEAVQPGDVDPVKPEVHWTAN